jgi:hypothetical protein
VFGVFTSSNGEVSYGITSSDALTWLLALLSVTVPCSHSLCHSHTHCDMVRGYAANGPAIRAWDPVRSSVHGWLELEGAKTPACCLIRSISRQPLQY